MPCDNYYTHAEDNTYSECIDFIETIYMYHNNDCNYCTAFPRDNAHTNCLNTFVNRNNFEISWDHPLYNQLK